jgi:2-alkyl-3-oxoalkanoate reductase
MPRALVTGATGLVGSHVVERLRQQGWDVRAFCRPAAAGPLRASGVEPLIGDLLDADGFAQAAQGCEMIVHTAAVITQRGGWETYRRTNVEGTLAAIAAAERSHARLVQVSSVAVYGPSARYLGDGRLTDEDSALQPLPEHAHYARSKRESELLVMQAHRDGRIWATAVRPSVIYGPRDRQFVPRLARLARRGMVPIIGTGNTTLAVVHAAHVADGCVLAGLSDAAGGQAYNLVADFPVTANRFFQLAAQGLGRPVRVLHIPAAVARGGFALFRVADRLLLGGRYSVATGASIDFLTRDDPFSSARARSELGWTPTIQPEQGIPEAFAAHRAE